MRPLTKRWLAFVAAVATAATFIRCDNGIEGDPCRHVNSPDYNGPGDDHADDEVYFAHPYRCDGNAVRLGRAAAGCQRLELGGLSRDEIARFVAHAARRDAPSELVDQLLALTGGNPFFVEELIAELAMRGWATEALGSCPVGVRAAMAARCEPLTARAASALAVAAVADNAAPLALVERVAALSRAEALAALDEAIEAGLVARSPPEQPTFTFAPPMVRRAIYDDLEPALRRELHGKVAEALAERDDEHGLPLLAHHLARTGRDGDRQRAVRCASAAGGLALARGDAGEAERHHRAALALSEGMAQLEVAALVGVAAARVAAGWHAQAREPLRRAAASARAIGDGELLGCVAVARSQPFEPSPLPDPELAELLEEARGVASEPAHLSALMAGVPPYFDTPAGGDLAREALAEARDAIVRVAAARAWYASARADERVAIADRLRDFAQASGALEHLADAHFLRFGAMLAEDDLPAARSELDLLEQLPLRAYVLVEADSNLDFSGTINFSLELWFRVAAFPLAADALLGRNISGTMIGDGYYLSLKPEDSFNSTAPSRLGARRSRRSTSRPTSASITTSSPCTTAPCSTSITTACWARWRRAPAPRWRACRCPSPSAPASRAARSTSRASSTRSRSMPTSSPVSASSSTTVLCSQAPRSAPDGRQSGSRRRRRGAPMRCPPSRSRRRNNEPTREQRE